MQYKVEKQVPICIQLAPFDSGVTKVYSRELSTSVAFAPSCAEAE